MPTRLFTPVQLPQLSPRFQPQTSLLALGSCFAEAMGNRWLELDLRGQVNPFGPLFNPASIALALERLLDGEYHPQSSELFRSEGGWVSFDFHGRFGQPDPAAALAKMEESLALGRRTLESASWLLLTWGTALAWYHESKPERPVANCHRRPGTEFSRRLQRNDEIANVYENLFGKLRERHPELKIILSVSPVRHLRQSAMENSLSKAHLLVAAQELAAAHPGQVFYFPAYEIMIDELRDYRFYASDLCHPTPLAETMVWEKFLESVAGPELRQCLKERTEILQMQRHRALHPELPAEQERQAEIARRLTTFHRRWFPPSGEGEGKKN